MTRAASIGLLLLLLLNVMGYYGVFLGLRYQNSREFMERLDSGDLGTSSTITLKIPLSVPYYGDTDFERVEGEFEYQGEFYRLVKQKLEKDTLHIVCVRDTKSEHIQRALSDYVRTFSDQSADNSRVKIVPSFIKDYCSNAFQLEYITEGWSIMLPYAIPVSSLSNSHASCPSPPPRA